MATTGHRTDILAISCIDDNIQPTFNVTATVGVMDSFSLVNYLPPKNVKTQQVLRIEEARELPIDLKCYEEVSDGLKDILDTVFPAREFQDDGEEWIQIVSKWAADREAV